MRLPEHRSRAFSSAFRVLGDAAAAEDVVQDVFLALWRESRPLRPRAGQPRGYVAMMAAQPRRGSRALDRRPGAPPLSASACRDEERPGDEDGPARGRHPARRARADAGGRGKELPAPQRDAVLLAFGRGLSAAEIAEASDTPLGTAKSRLRLGLEKTREKLDAAA